MVFDNYCYYPNKRTLFWLRFLPTHVVRDASEGITIYFKTWRGVVFIVREDHDPKEEIDG
jgi:hypothetical protein